MYNAYLITPFNEWELTMENKSLFSAIVLAFALIAGYFFYSEKLDTLEQEVEGITQEYNQKNKRSSANRKFKWHL